MASARAFCHQVMVHYEPIVHVNPKGLYYYNQWTGYNQSSM